MKRILTIISMTTFLAVAALAQSNGPFSITQSVITNGGGTSANGPFEVTGTMAQPLTTTSDGPPFQVRSGFWQSSFAPTAAGVTLAGRVRTADGRGLRGAVVMTIDQNGSIRSARTGTFGYYRIDGFEAGQTLTVSVVSRKFQFQTRIVELSDNLEDFDFISVRGENL